MAKIECNCGTIINVTNEYNEFDLVPGSWIEFVSQKIEVGELAEQDFFESFLEVNQTLYKCSGCYRLWFENKDGTFTAYIPEYRCKESLADKKIKVDEGSSFKRLLSR